MHFAEVAVAVLLALVAFVGGVRFGVWICEHEMKSVKPEPNRNRIHMLTHEKYAQKLRR
jgi:uncharacterized protein YneF (UPF0154 family)